MWRTRTCQPDSGSASSDWKNRLNPAGVVVDWRKRDGSNPARPPLKRSRAVDADSAAFPDWRNRKQEALQTAAAESSRGVSQLSDEPDGSLPSGTLGARLNLDLGALGTAVGNPALAPKKLDPATMSHAAANGVSRSRIGKLMTHGACNCKRECARQFRPKVVEQMCLAFWQIPKDEQDFIIHTMYGAQQREASGGTAAATAASWRDRTTCPEDDTDDAWVDHDMGDARTLTQIAKTRVQWALGDRDVCMEAFYRLLGLGKHRLLKAVGGAVDLRRTYPGMAKKQMPKEPKQSLLCHKFFAELYVSSAEPMPTEFRTPGKDVMGEVRPQASAEPIDIAAMERELQDLLPHFLGDSSSEAKLCGAPVRMIQYSRIHDLYWLFLATLQEWIKPTEAKPSWMTFWRCWNSTWAKFLAFRTTSEHSKCTICWKAHQCFKRHISLSDKHAVAKTLREHLRMQYADRCCYWAMRWSSRLKTANILVLIVDAMDKSKLPIPRWAFGVKPKVRRPAPKPPALLGGLRACALLHSTPAAL